MPSFFPKQTRLICKKSGVRWVCKVRDFFGIVAKVEGLTRREALDKGRQARRQYVAQIEACRKALAQLKSPFVAFGKRRRPPEQP